MEYRILGRTGLRVSRLGFGGIPIQRVEQAVASDMLALCREAGINFIDSARGYTDSEEKIGIAIAGHRDSFYLASKSTRRDYAGFWSDIHLSLLSLRTDHLDLYQLHMVNSQEIWQSVCGKNGALAALQKARRDGLVRFIGISSHNNAALMEIIRTGVFDTVQVPFNAVEQQFTGSLNLSLELGMGSIAMKPLGGGALENTALALRYLIATDVSTIIPGMDSVEQVRQNTAAVDQGPLSAAEWQELSNEAQSLGDDFCRRCEYCLPCPQNIRIPSVFVLERYARRYGLADWARERYNGLPSGVAACTECRLCEGRCPYHLPIREKLKKAGLALI